MCNVIGVEIVIIMIPLSIGVHVLLCVYRLQLTIDSSLPSRVNLIVGAVKKHSLIIYYRKIFTSEFLLLKDFLVVVHFRK